MLDGGRVQGVGLADGRIEEAECITDVRGSAPYKRELTRVYVGRALHQALSSNGAGR